MNVILSTLQKYRSFLILNSVVLGTFATITAYIAVSRITNNSRHVDHANYILRAFEKPFTQRNPQIGIFPDISMLLWAASAFVCLFTFYLVQSRTQHCSWAERYFVLYPGLLIGLVTLDEAFRIKLMLALYGGIPKFFVYLVYGILAFIFVYYFRRQIKRTPYPILGIAAGFFIISGLTDSFPMDGRGLPIMLEDATKIVGAANLALYFWQICIHQVHQHLAVSTATQEPFPPASGNEL